MRHLKAGRKLGRTASHRKATMRALSVALINHRRIVTTLAKAKELRRYFEPLVTKAKTDTTHSRRQIFSFLQDKKAVSLMFEEVAPVVGDRPGGYTRIIKVGARQGDGAETAMIELVDFNDVKPETKSKRKKRTRRGAGGGKKSIKASKEETKAKKADEGKSEKTSDKKSEKKTGTKAKTKAEEKPEKKEETKAKATSKKQEETKAKAKKEAETEPEKTKAKAKSDDKGEAKAEEKKTEKKKGKSASKGEKEEE